MSGGHVGRVWRLLEGLEDPRTGNATLHHLHDLLMIALCSVICGGANAMDMAAFEKATEPLLRGFLRLPTACRATTPSAGCSVCWIYAVWAAFQRFMAMFSQQCQGVVAIDGKVLRRSHDHASGKSALHYRQRLGLETRNA